MECFSPFVLPSRMELWKPVVGFEGLYEVSTFGRVRSIERRARHSCGMGTRRVSQRILKTAPDHQGYPTVRLSRDGKYFPRRVHRLVLESFVGPAPHDKECSHDDGNPSNCALSNLAYKTHTENLADRLRHGTDARGEKSPTAKLNVDQVTQIRQRFVFRDKVNGRNALAREFGVSPSTIYLIVRRKRWAHI